MREEARPNVNLDFTSAWCHRHAGALQAEWPRGAALAMVGIFKAITSDDRFVALMPKDGDGKADSFALDAVLSECTPLCCFVGDDVAGAVIEAALAGSVWEPA